MELNVNNVFKQRALDALAQVDLSDKDNEKLCDKLITLCKKYSPDTFKLTSQKRKEKQKYGIKQVRESFIR